MKKFSKYWLPVIFYAVLIFFLSSVPGEKIPQLFEGEDILFHLIEYFILALLINRAFKAYCICQHYLKRFLWVSIIAVLYAAGDEFHQSFIPNRTSSIFDLYIDTAGIVVANILYR